MKKIILVLVVVLALMMVMSLSIGTSLAQNTATATPKAKSTTAAQADSTVTIFAVICENQAVVNLSGTMGAGYNVFYQVYSGPQATGTALTNLRRVQVSGAYAFSEAVPYSGGTVASGTTGSVKVYIAKPGSPNTPAGDTFKVDDVQDGCNNAQNPIATSVDTGAGAGGTTTTTGTTGVRIRSPFGGFINTVSAELVAPEGPVVIGARKFVNPQRSTTPGVIFAECNNFLPAAAPGVVYDNDNITIFWSWYAKTAAQVQDHISKAQYNVTLNRAPLINVATSDIQVRGGNNWVFYTANIGNLKPGQYGVEYKLTWSEQTFDGYKKFGPGTNTLEQDAGCLFTVDRNPNNADVVYNNIYSVR